MAADSVNGDTEATTNTPPSPSPSPTLADSDKTPSPKLEIKYVDSKYSEDPKGWQYEDTSNPAGVPAELVQPVGMDTSGDDSWDEFCFVVVRRHPKPKENNEGTRQIAFEIVVKSPYLLKACKEVMAHVRGISWNSPPVTLEPKLLLTFFPKFEAHERKLAELESRTEEEEAILASVRVLLDYMRKNYRQTLARIASLVSHSEITFDLLYAILIPGTVFVLPCPVTRELRAMRLLSSRFAVDPQCGPYYRLSLEGLDSAQGAEDEDDNDDKRWTAGTGVGGGGGGKKNGPRFGMTEHSSTIRDFEGVEKIYEQCAFPLEYHPEAERVSSMLVERARKWGALNGMFHMHYRGIAVKHVYEGRGEYKMERYSVNSRIMVDKANFTRISSYEPPMVHNRIPLRDGKRGAKALTKDELLLASPIIYGFSFADKMWLEFNINHISPIDWNEEVFAGLVLPEARKNLLRSLIEANGKLNEGGTFDDFVRGKGQGLVINLFGPPGVGKTLSAEATSEHLKRPLYIVGSGDLGTSAGDVDRALGRAFDLAASWNAVLLIDEADVFLEQRSLHDLQRNAMVAVFLRHVEYYRGILFLTTNRITSFDEAFLSRIHVALHFGELSRATKARIWRAFLKKAGLGGDDAERLAERGLNGRQIKNACRTAASLALSRGERMQHTHLEEALDAMEEFMSEFKSLQANAQERRGWFRRLFSR